MPQALLIVLGGALVWACCLSLGRLALRATPARLYLQEENPLAFVIGSAIVSLIMFALCALGQARRGYFYALAGLCLLAGYRFGAFRRDLRPRFPALPRAWRWLFIAGFGAFTWVYFINAMLPEFSPDGVSYHLSFVSRYVRERGFVRIPTNMYAQLSQGIELLYVMAFAVGRHSATSLVHFGFMIALALGVLGYARRIGYPKAGVAASLLVYASPVVGIDGTTSYIDVAVAAILFTTFYLVQIWDQERSTSLLVLIGLVAGFGYAAKYTAFLAVPYAAGFVLWRTRRIKPAAIVAACSVILIAPWVIKNIVWVGNPFSPMFNRWFPNPLVHIAFETYWTNYLKTYFLETRWSIPLETTIRGAHLCGLLGPVFLLLPFGFFAARSSPGRRALFAAVLFTLPYFSNIGTRFFIPPLAFWSLAMALAAVEIPIALAAVVVFHLVLSWPTMTGRYSVAHAWRLTRVPHRPAFRIEPQANWLRRTQPEYRVAEMINSATKLEDVVFTFNGLAESYIQSQVMLGFQSGSGDNITQIFYAGFNPDFQPSATQTFTMPPSEVRRLRIVQTAKPFQSFNWVLSEIRVFSRGEELARSPNWRLTSNPNPWDVQMAFDNTPVTSWSSWEAFRPGMFLEIDFGSPVTVDKVVLEAPPQSKVTAVKLEGLDTSGRWRTIAESAAFKEGKRLGFMGRAAMREIKARHVDFILIRNNEHGAPEVLEGPADWGLTLMGQSDSARLYRIDAGLPELITNEDVKTVSRR